MKCEVCKRGPADGVTVIRQNPKGEPGIWRCTRHSKVATDPVVSQIDRALNDRRTRNDVE